MVVIDFEMSTSPFPSCAKDDMVLRQTSSIVDLADRQPSTPQSGPVESSSGSSELQPQFRAH